MPKIVSSYVISPDARRVAILINPKSGRRAAGPWAERLAALLKKQGFEAELYTDLAEATTAANRWHAEGTLRTLVAAGGDGTAAELVNRTSEGVAITLLPAGNSNLLAGYLGLKKDPELLCRAVAEGTVARLDAGRANGRIFLIMAGCGFDAEVVRRLHENRTGHVSNSTYLKPIARAIWSYDFPEIRVQCHGAGGAERQLSARWVFAFNLPCYGGGFRIAPRADGSDGLLDLCVFRRGGFLAGVKYAAVTAVRRPGFTTDYETQPVERLEITADRPVPYQLDGDPGGWLPLEVEVLPGRLALVVMREGFRDLRIGFLLCRLIQYVLVIFVAGGGKGWW